MKLSKGPGAGSQRDLQLLLQVMGTVGGLKHLKRPIDILGRSLKAEDFYFIYINLFFEIPPHAFFLQCQTSQEQEHGILWGISPAGSDFGHGA